MSDMRHRGFSLIELLVVISIIAVLAALLIPVISLVRDQSRQVECLNNIRQSMMGVLAYAGDNEGATPPGDDCWWQDAPGHYYKPRVNGILVRHWTEFLVCFEYIETRDGAITVGNPWPDSINIARWPSVIGCSVFRPKYLPIPSSQATNFGMRVHTRPGERIVKDAFGNWIGSFHLSTLAQDYPLLADAIYVNNGDPWSTLMSQQVWGQAGARINLPHRGRAAVAFPDGHVQAMDRSALVTSGVDPAGVYP